MVKYSICVTHYNMKDNLPKFLQSVLSQLTSDFEVVICDNCSNDGSLEILHAYSKTGRVKLLVEKSSRGKGRQIAFVNSNGDYIISGLDADDVIKPALNKILRLYHAQHEGFVLSYGTIHFIPRHLVEAVGGWRDLQFGEDIDFIRRIDSLGKLHYFNDASAIIEKRGRHTRDNLSAPKELFRCKYQYYRCRYQIGFNIFEEITKDARIVWYRRPTEFLIALVSVAACKIKREGKFI